MAEDYSLPERFVARRWADPLAEKFGFPVNSIYTETIMLPILGPSACWCLRRLSAWVSAGPRGVEVDARRLARDLGLGDGLGRHAAITRTLRRLCHFEMAAWAHDVLMVRTAVAPLPERQLTRLSPELAQVHHLMVRHQAASYAGGPILIRIPCQRTGWVSGAGSMSGGSGQPGVSWLTRRVGGQSSAGQWTTARPWARPTLSLPGPARRVQSIGRRRSPSRHNEGGVRS